MSTTNDTSTPTTRVGTLADLRRLGDDKRPTADSLLRVASRQAALLARQLPAVARDIPERITALMPNIVIEYIAELPVSSISFWARTCWHIHIRAGDPTEQQITSLLRQLKYIIDFPLRRDLGGALPDIDWVAQADHFAAQVRLRKPSPTVIWSDSP